MEKPQSTFYGDDEVPSSSLFYIPVHTDSGTSAYPHAYPPPIRRQRLRSLPVGLGDDDVADRFHRSMHLGPSPEDTLNGREDKGKGAETKTAKPESGIRSLIRRASISLKNHTKPRRASHSHTHNSYEPAGARPMTSSSAWHKLKSAASFRNIKNMETLGFGHRDHQEALEAFDDIDEPIPGKGTAPPVIPRRCGGEAARATAAAQNEMLRQMQVEKDIYPDCESAVELSLPYYMETRMDKARDAIVRIDFIARLPAELAAHILSMLDHTGLAQASEVSKKWYELANTNHVWRESFYRDKSETFAMGHPVQPGTGLGLPPKFPAKQWKEAYRARQQLDRNWQEGEALAIYLHGHTDSIYCVQFDE